MRENKRKEKSLCWECANALNDGDYGCSWSKSFIPVDGWLAIRDEKKVYCGIDESYTVFDCPEFIPDKDANHTYESTGIERLANAIVKRAAIDYRDACMKEKREREKDSSLLTKRKLYGGAYKELYGYSLPYGMIEVENFFKTQYAEMLSDSNGEYLTSEIRSMVGL